MRARTSSNILFFTDSGPVRHLALGGSIAEPAISWEQNSLDVRKIDVFRVTEGSAGASGGTRFVKEPNITFKEPLRANTIISVIATTDDQQYSSDASRAIYTYESGEPRIDIFRLMESFSLIHRAIGREIHTEREEGDG